MNTKHIKNVFKLVFNNMPNPIFCFPLLYFQHKNYLCEVATSKKYNQLRWNNCEYHSMSPLLILEGLFVADGFYVTVLEQVGNKHMYCRRLDLSDHIDTIKELNSFINKKLSN